MSWADTPCVNPVLMPRRFLDEPGGYEMGLNDADVLAWCREAWEVATVHEKFTLSHRWRQAGYRNIKGVLRHDSTRVDQKVAGSMSVKPPAWRIRLAVWRARPADGDVRKWVYGV